MSSRKEASDRSRVGAHGDRRQPPALVKTSSGIKSKTHNLLRKRSSTNVNVDEEEWNQRMQTWEKKRQRLSSSDWDRSFREAVHNRLKGKKPWRNPISKTSLHKESLRSDSEKFANIDAEFKQKHQSTYKEDGKLGEISLEVVGLQRETSRMDLNVTTFTHPGSFDQVVQTPKESNFSKSLEANNRISNNAEKSDDITWTKSLRLTDTNNLAERSTMFIKTVLSPIQSESECSKVGGEVHSSDGQNVINESTELMKGKSNENNSLQLPETRTGMFTDNTEIISTKLWKESKTEQLLPSEQSLKRQMEMISYGEINQNELKAEQNTPSEQSPVKTSQLEMDSNAQNTKKKSKGLSLLQNTAEKLQANHESQCFSEKPQFIGLKNGQESSSSTQEIDSSSQIASEPQINHILATDKAKTNNNQDGNNNDQQPHKETKNCKHYTKEKASHKDSKEDRIGPRKRVQVPGDFQINTIREASNTGAESHQCNSSSGEKESQRKNKLSNSSAEGKVGNVDNIVTLGKYSQSHQAQLVDTVNTFPPETLKREIVVASNLPNDKTSKYPAQELCVISSKSKNYIPLSGNNWESNKEPKGTIYSNSSLTIAYPSKDRTLLHAIFSSPDTEIFGSRKKPPAHPVFIRTEFTEFMTVPANQMDIVECISKDSFELHAKARPLSDESLMVLDVESVETLDSIPGAWYKELQHPVMSSEEFESDQAESDCYREIIIDRSGCKGLFKGTCHTKMSKGYDNNCCLSRRFEVCHDASKCALKKATKRKSQVQFEDIKIYNEESSTDK